MNATNRSAARAASVVCSVLAIALAGCQTHVVHEQTRTVYVPAPPPVVYAPPAPVAQPPPPTVVLSPPEQPSVVVIQSENDFYEPLAAYGRWEVVGSYGRCWIPARVDSGWRPYSNGYWQRTDAGWYWASDEPWGWATYHYGRWDFHAQFGWIWVPQTQWAPAWVSWREGGGYVGWAPLRPSVNINVNIGAVNYESAYASRAFVFVEHRRMLEPVRAKTVIVNNTTIINKTVNITNVKVVNKTVINEGPRPEVIERESGRKVQSVPVREFRHREESTVAARERNIPTAAPGKIQPPARTEVQPAPRQAVLPRNAHVAGNPVVGETPPARPPAAHAQLTPPRTHAGKPAHNENKQEAEGAKKTETTLPTVEPKAKPEVRAAKAVLPRRDIQTVEKQVVAVKPTPQPVTTNPIPNETKRETTAGKQNTSMTPAVEPKSKNGVGPETRNAVSSPVKVETGRPAAVSKHAAPPSEKVVANRLNSPKEKSQAAARTEAAGKKKADNSPKQKKGEDQETPPVVVPTHPPQ